MDHLSSFISSTYQWAILALEGSNVSGESDYDDSYWSLSTLTENMNFSQDYCARVFLYRPTANLITYMEFTAVFDDDTSTQSLNHGMGRRTSAEVVNAVRFAQDTGNLNAGIIRLYRLAQS